MPGRMLRESICYSETLAGLSAEAERLFYRLITEADDFGRFDARPCVVRSRCFRLGGVSDDKVMGWLTQLRDNRVVCIYEVEGKDYGHFPTWEKYQRIRSPRSRYPDPPHDAAGCGELPQVAAENGSRARASGIRTRTRSKNSLSNSRQLDAQWPEDFTLTLERTEAATTFGLDAATEWNKFHDHALKDGVTHKNWDAAWRYWCRRAPEFQRRKMPWGT